MQAGNRRISPLRACAAGALTLLLVLPEAPAYAQRRGGGGEAGRAARSAASTAAPPGRAEAGRARARAAPPAARRTGNTSSRTTTAQTRSGETATANRNVSKSGDEVTVNRNAQIEQRRQQELAEDVRDGQRAGRVGGARHPGDEPVRPDGRAGKARPSAPATAGSSRARARTSTGRRSRPRATARADPTAAASWRTSRAAATATGRSSRAGAYGGPVHAAQPALRRPSLQLLWPLVLRLRRRLLPALLLPRRSVLRLHARRPGAATTRRSRSAPSR